MIEMSGAMFVLGLFSALVVGMAVGMLVERWLYRGVRDSIYRIYE